jgi:hypothetical protein
MLPLLLSASFVALSLFTVPSSAVPVTLAETTDISPAILEPRDDITIRSLGDFFANPGSIDVELMRGFWDAEKANRQPRRNCVFYVNPKDPPGSTRGKEAAIKFAANMEAKYPGHDYHTLYDVYDSSLAFNGDSGPMMEAAAVSNDTLRDWFKITSRRFAMNCIGKVFLIVEPSQQIWEGSIWTTDEEQAIREGNGSIGPIIEVNPDEVLWGLDITETNYRKHCLYTIFGNRFNLCFSMHRRATTIKYSTFLAKPAGWIPAPYGSKW